MTENNFWLTLWGVVGAFLCLFFFIATQAHGVQEKSSNKLTLECYKVLKDKSAGDLRITCGVIK